MQQLMHAPIPKHEPIERPAERPRLSIHAPGEIRRRVAAALGTRPGQVAVERVRIAPSGLNLHCSGVAEGMRFHAKLYLVDHYPAAQRFALPSDELHAGEERTRPIELHLALECKALEKMRSLLGTRNNPTVLGYSLAERTLVFEAVEGQRVDSTARWAWPGTSRLKSAETALFHAGAWLKRLHWVSFQEWEMVTPLDIVRQAHWLLEVKRTESTLPFEALATVCGQIGLKTRMQVPVAMNHGDFAPANLIWESAKEHLWVVDFEHSGCRPILHDLGSMVFALRQGLLDPRISPASIRKLEQAFWLGYGNISAQFRLLVNAVATHRLLDHSLARIATLGERHGWWGDVKASVYRRFLQRFMVRHILRAMSHPTGWEMPVTL